MSLLTGARSLLASGASLPGDLLEDSRKRIGVAAIVGRRHLADHPGHDRDRRPVVQRQPAQHLRRLAGTGAVLHHHRHRGGRGRGARGAARRPAVALAARRRRPPDGGDLPDAGHPRGVGADHPAGAALLGLHHHPALPAHRGRFAASDALSCPSRRPRTVPVALYLARVRGVDMPEHGFCDPHARPASLPVRRHRGGSGAPHPATGSGRQGAREIGAYRLGKLLGEGGHGAGVPRHPPTPGPAGGGKADPRREHQGGQRRHGPDRHGAVPSGSGRGRRAHLTRTPSRSTTLAPPATAASSTRWNCSRG